MEGRIEGTIKLIKIQPYKAEGYEYYDMYALQSV